MYLCIVNAKMGGHGVLYVIAQMLKSRQSVPRLPSSGYSEDVYTLGVSWEIDQVYFQIFLGGGRGRGGGVFGCTYVHRLSAST